MVGSSSEGVQRPAFVFMLLLVLMTDAVTRFFCSASGAEANGNKLALTLVIALYFPSLCDPGGGGPSY